MQYAGPQCFPQLKDPVRLQANSQFVSKKKKKTDKATAKGSKADGDVDELEDIAFQLQHCWLRCDKCGARRLVSSECMTALTTEAYQKDLRIPNDKDMPDGYVAGRWRAWLGGARSRYSSWLNATRSGSCVNADEAAVVAGAVDGEELGRSRDESGDDVGVDNQGEGGLQSAHGLAEGDSSGGVDGSRFKGVSSADLAEAMRAVGSKVQRQADGGYLLEEERKFLDDGVEDGDPYLDGVETERHGVMDAPRARVRFECDMLITREMRADAKDGERKCSCLLYTSPSPRDS